MVPVHAIAGGAPVPPGRLGIGRGSDPGIQIEDRLLPPEQVDRIGRGEIRLPGHVGVYAAQREVDCAPT